MKKSTQNSVNTRRKKTTASKRSPRLAEILAKIDWETIAAEMAAAYPDMHPKEIARLKRVYRELLRLTPAASAMKIHLHVEKDEDLQWIDVCGMDGSFRESFGGSPTQKKVKEHFALDFTPWEQWLGMRVTKEARARYSPSEIAAHCIWEMTFWGSTQKQIQKNAPRG